MAISSFNELKAKVLAQLGRTDVSDVDLADYIMQAEAELNLLFANAELLEMQDTVTLTASGTSLALPDDFYSLVSVENDGFEMLQRKNENSRRGYQIGNGTLKLGNYSYPSATFEVTYNQALPPLETNDTNWLLQKYPHIYLHGALRHAFIRYRNPDAAAASLQVILDSMELMKGVDANRKVANASMTIYTTW